MSMNLISITSNSDDDGRYLNINNVCRISKYVYEREIFGIATGEIIEKIMIVFDNVEPNTTKIEYDDGIWNRFYLTPGWHCSKDDKTIFNGACILEMVAHNGRYMVYVIDSYYASNNYIRHRKIGIEISYKIFHRIRSEVV